MEQKLRELTEKIYAEGVEKGEARAKEIIRQAEEKAALILSEARQKASEIAASAQNDASALRQKIETELRLSGLQAVSKLKESITSLVSAKALDHKIKSALEDPAFIKELIKTIVQKWDVHSAGVPVFEVLLPESKRAELEKAFQTAADKALTEGISFQYSKAIQGGFRISPAGLGFKLHFTDQDFAEFFKDYLKPKTREFLFKE